MYYNTGGGKEREDEKRWFISLIIGIIMVISGCLGYLQYGRDMDVYGSYAMTADNYHEERLTVVVNKLYVADQKVCAEEIVKRCRENSFKVCGSATISRFRMRYM